MAIRFTKMHGLGNDFVVIDAVRQRIRLTDQQVRHIADRHTGIGCDQLLLVEPPEFPEVDFGYRIYNADGGEVGQCGNGARCFARFVRDQGLTDKHSIRVNTASGQMTLEVLEDEQVRVDMGEPVFTPEDIPFVTEEQADFYQLSVGTNGIEIGAVSMGNPHAVLLVEDADTAPVDALGPLIENHNTFVERANVGFMQIIDRNHIKLRVFERGAGETLACGSGACAAVAVGINRGDLDNNVTVQLTGGELVISWAGIGHPLYMTGPVTNVFEGTIGSL